MRASHRTAGIGKVGGAIAGALSLATAAAVGLALSATPASADAEATATTVPTFGAQTLVGAKYDYLQSMGMNLYEVLGNATEWAVLQPDGVNFDTAALDNLDNQIRLAFDQGMTQLSVRVRPGGSANPFDGDPSTWPVDPTEYVDFKDGEYLGPLFPVSSYSFPPRGLSDDSPGNESAWYVFVKTLAERYSGNTPDPKRAGQNLPFVEFWSCVEEPDVQSFWYGTSMDYYGGVGGDPTVGTLPSFYRAVKAGSPSAQVIGGGLTSHKVGHYLTHEQAAAAGNLYTPAVRQYGRDYFHTSVALAGLYDVPLTDAALFNHFETDLDFVRSRTMIDALFSATADDYYDIVGMHMYDNAEMLPDVIDFYQARMQGSHALWITELGVTDQLGDGNGFVTEGDQSRWVFKKIVYGLAGGVAHMAYAPVFAFGGVAQIYDDLSSPRSVQRSFQLLGQTLNEEHGYTYGGTVSSGGTDFYVFDHEGGVRHMAAAWRPDGSTASQDAETILGIPGGSTIAVLDHVEGLVGSSASSLSFGDDPLAIFWGDSAIDFDGDGYPTPVDCNDLSATVHPGATEIGGNLIDDDCEPSTTGGTACGAVVPGSGDGAMNLLILMVPALGVAARRVRRSRRA